MKSRKLALARYKTEVVVVNNRKSEQRVHISVGDCTIESKQFLRHLGVMVDDKLSFASHVEYTCEGVSTAIAPITRMMNNSSAVIASKRKLLTSVALSILKYGGQSGQRRLKQAET